MTERVRKIIPNPGQDLRRVSAEGPKGYHYGSRSPVILLVTRHAQEKHSSPASYREIDSAMGPLIRIPIPLLAKVYASIFVDRFSLARDKGFNTWNPC